MPTTHRLVLGALFVTIAIAGCGVAAPAPGVAGRTFISTAVTEDGAERPLVPGTQIRLDFGSDGRLGVTAGCNSMGGAFAVEGDRLVVADGAMTAIGCDAARHAQDEWLFDFLAARPQIALAGNELALTEGATVIRLIDAEVAEPDQPLVGPVWTLESIRNGETVSTVPADLTATLQFAPDGTVAINAGCNIGSARVEGDGAELRFNELLLTRRACERPGAQLEASVLSVLQAPAVTAAIDASTLTLEADGTGLTFSAR